MAAIPNLEKARTVFQKRGIGGRVLLDIVGIFGCLVAAYILAYFYTVLSRPHRDPRELLDIMIQSFSVTFPLLTAIVLVVFGLFGIYTRARQYAGRYKLVTLFNAISLSFALQVVIVYFVRNLPLPRSAVLLSYVLVLLGLVGPRLLKTYLFRSYQVTPIRHRRGDRRILVIGGAGYIGSVLVRQLLQRNVNVRVLDNFLYGPHSLEDCQNHPNLEVMTGDFRHTETMVQAVKEMDDVVHLGGLVGDPACSLDRDVTVQINLASTKMIRDVCAGYQINRIVFASTCSVYGATEEICSEISEPNPLSLYASTKIDSERVLLSMPEVSSLQPVMLRLSTVYGPSPRPRFDLVVNLLTAQAWFERGITISNPGQWRPFIHVEDVARAMVMVLEAPADLVSRQIFNVGDDSMNCTLGDLGQLISRIVPGVKIEIVHRSSDARNYRVSFDKIRRQLGYECKYSLEYGIRQLCSLFERNTIQQWKDDLYSNERRLRRLDMRPLEDEMPIGWTKQLLTQRKGKQVRPV